MGGEEKWAAIEDVARLRDALGVQPPAGVAHVFLEPVIDPLGDLVGRYARTHGPFTAGDASAALGLPPAVVETALGVLADARAGGCRSLSTWRCRPGVGRPRRPEAAQASIAGDAAQRDRGRRPASARSVRRGLARGEPDPPRGRNSLHDSVARLAGLAIPASVLERDVLRARVADPGPGLDRLMLDGALVWVGLGPLGVGDGKVGLFPRESLDVLWRGPEAPPDTTEHADILKLLDTRGASFFRDIYEGTGGGDPEATLDRLWDLVWAGQVTNDTLEPVRAFHQLPQGPLVGETFPFQPFSGSCRWTLVTHQPSADPGTDRHRSARLPGPTSSSTAMAW